MIIVNAIDYGTAPEFLIRGVSSIERISPGQIRVSYYGVYRGMKGESENRIVTHFVWDREEFMQAFAMFQALRRQIEAGMIDCVPTPRSMAH